MASRNQSNVKLTGFKELETALLKLSPELAKIAEASALRYGMMPVRTAARRYVKRIKDTGLLGKSIGLNVKRVRRKLQYQNRYTARVGAQSGHGKIVNRRIIGTTKNGMTRVRFVKEYADPVNYAHLIEYGTSKMSARPFIRPAVESSEDKIMAGLQKGYEKGMVKVVKKIRSRK
jgi:HK97 gp10 family phage protein